MGSSGYARSLGHAGRNLSYRSRHIKAKLKPGKSAIDYHEIDCVDTFEISLSERYTLYDVRLQYSNLGYRRYVL